MMLHSYLNGKQKCRVPALLFHFDTDIFSCQCQHNVCTGRQNKTFQNVIPSETQYQQFLHTSIYLHLIKRNVNAMKLKTENRVYVRGQLQGWWWGGRDTDQMSQIQSPALWTKQSHTTTLKAVEQKWIWELDVQAYHKLN